MTLDKLIKELPIEYQAWAMNYANVLLEMADEEMLAWTEDVLAGDIRSAYARLANAMTTTQLILAQNDVNEELRILNEANATFVELQRRMVLEAVRIGLILFRGQQGFTE